MRIIKEIIKTPIVTMFIFLAVLITILSFDIIIQVIVSNYQIESVEGSFYEDHLSVQIENLNIKKLEGFDGDYILDPVEIKQVKGNGFGKAKMFGANNYSNITNEFKTKNNIYISESDYINGNKVAIIGTLIDKYTYEKDGVKKLDILGDEYTVLDIIDDSRSYMWRRAIVIPVSAYPEDIYESKKINIYKKNESELGKVDSRFKVESINENKFNKLEILKRAINVDKGILKDNILMIFIGSINLIIAMIFWIKSLKEQVMIKLMIGARREDILKEGILKILIITVIAFLASRLISETLISAIARNFLSPIKYSLSAGFITLGVSVVIVVLLSAVSMIRYLNIFEKGGIK